MIEPYRDIFFHDACSFWLVTTDGIAVVPPIKPNVDLAFKEMTMALHHME